MKYRIKLRQDCEGQAAFSSQILFLSVVSNLQLLGGEVLGRGNERGFALTLLFSQVEKK